MLTLNYMLFWINVYGSNIFSQLLNIYNVFKLKIKIKIILKNFIQYSIKKINYKYYLQIFLL